MPAATVVVTRIDPDGVACAADKELVDEREAQEAEAA